MKAGFVLGRLPGGDTRRPTSRGGPAWIVCCGRTLEVHEDQAHCPREGVVSLHECLDCHLLVTIARERDPRYACSTDD